MNRLGIVTAGIALAATALPANAHALPSRLIGFTCGLESEGDPTVEGKPQTGPVRGGPALSLVPLATVGIRCDVQTGSDSTHSGTDRASASGSGLMVAVVPDTLRQYVVADGQPTWLCTRWTLNGVHHYYDGATGTFSTSSAVDCVLAVTQFAGDQRTDAVAQQLASF